VGPPHLTHSGELDRLAEEQAALREIATMLARGAPARELFATVAEQVARVLHVPVVSIVRYEDEQTASECASYSERGELFAVGARWSLDGTNVVRMVLDTRAPARIDDYTGLYGQIAELCRGQGICSTVGIPIVVAGRVWGAMVVSSMEPDPLDEGTEARLADFTELVATAIANTEARAEVERLAEEQAALRRVATLVARESSPAKVFGVVAEEVAQLLGIEGVGMLRYDPDGAAILVAQSKTPWEPVPLGTRFALEGENVLTTVLRTERAARLDDWSKATGPAAAMADTLGIRSSVAAPIVVEGRLWGAMVGATQQIEPLPASTELRLGDFTELLATAIANAEARGELSLLAEEQGALRRVATLVAEEAPPSELLGAVVEEVGRLFHADLAGMIHYETDNAVTATATWAAEGEHPPVEGRWPLEGDRLATAILRTGQPAREDDWGDVRGPIGEFVRTRLGIVSSVGSPIVVEGRVWGALFVHSREATRPLPKGTEGRLRNFTELVATAMSNAQVRSEVNRLAQEQAGLRRVATLVAKESTPAEVFGAITEEVRRLFGDSHIYMFRYEGESAVVTVARAGIAEDVLPVGSRHELGGRNAATQIFDTGEPVRIDDYSSATGPIAEAVRPTNTRAVVGMPLVIYGRLWGVIVLGTRREERLPPETEPRLGQFTELLATAIANTESRGRADRLANEQRALRRVATLVASEASQAEVFTAVAEEIGRLLGTEETGMLRYEDDHHAVVMSRWGQFEDLMPIGFRIPLQDDSATARVFRTGRPARIDYGSASGSVADDVRSAAAIRDSVATPIMVEGRLWGAMVTGTSQAEPLPPETESRLGQFTALMATAIANTEARGEVGRLAEEQAALRRVATLVAQDVPPSELFAAVTEEVGKLLGGDLTGMIRYNADGTVSPVAAWAAAGEHPPLPSRWRTQEGDPATMVAEAGGPVRVDRWNEVRGPMAAFIRELGIQSSVGSPISVEGRLWGALAVHSSRDQPLPGGTESRLVSFTELVATAMANAETRREVERLAQEQVALRRVATLVAEGAKPAAVFDAVAGEMEALLGADQVALNRFEPGDEILVLAHRGLDVARTPVGSRVSIEGESATAKVRRTGLPARMENYEDVGGALAEIARATGLRSSVSAPVMVEGGLWGLITASWRDEPSPPADTEQRMSRFAQLLDTAIANAEARAELVASRARLVAASDEARRRFERDLHDGVQQRLVSVALELRSAEAIAQSDSEELAEQLRQVGKGLADALDGLRELSRGIHPAILSEGGLVPALKALARRSAVPVQLDLAIADRFAERVEIGAYYVVSEALTNAAKHARASKVEVHARARDGVLEMKIDDDGVGGADPSGGSGLTGLADRVEALGGTIWIASPPGEGTSLRVELSLDQ
jgi:GAF domain-containing protein